MADIGERLAALEVAVNRVLEGQKEVTTAVRDLAVLKRDIDYHSMDIGRAHDGIRELNKRYDDADSRLDILEGKELLNKWARGALFLATCALCKLAWDSQIIVNMDRQSREKPSFEASNSGEPK